MLICVTGDVFIMTSYAMYFPCFIVLFVDADLCHRGWIHHDESCYLFPRSELDWFSAAVRITVKVSVTFLILMDYLRLQFICNILKNPES